MKALQKIGIIAAGVLLVIILFNQIMGMIALTYGEEITGFAPPADIRAATWLVPTWIVTTVLIAVTMVLCALWRKKEKLSLIPMVLGIVGAVLAFVIALTFYAPYDMVLNSEGELAQSDWDWFWRHLSPAIISLITAVIAFLHFKRLRDARVRREENAYEEQFVPEETIAVPATKSSKKLSKRQRKAMREKEESGI